MLFQSIADIPQCIISLHIRTTHLLIKNGIGLYIFILDIILCHMGAVAHIADAVQTILRRYHIDTADTVNI